MTGNPVRGGDTYVFSVSGTVNHGHPTPFFPPDGENAISHYLGAENGIGDSDGAALRLPSSAFFWGPDQPDKSSNPPPRLDFGTSTNRDYLVLNPLLQQPFFIGDGLTDDGSVQKSLHRPGATRLFLGTMDEYEWSDNQNFAVKVDLVDRESGMPVPPRATPGHTNTEPLSYPDQVRIGPDSTLQLSLHPSVTPGPEAVVANPYTAITTNLEIHACTAIELSWSSESNRVYRVQWTPTLNQPQWTPLDPEISGTGIGFSIFDSTRIHPTGFYRVQIVQ